MSSIAKITAFLFCLLINATLFAQGNFYVINNTVVTPSPNNCSETQVDVRTYLGCRNFVNNGYTFTIQNDTIKIEVSYTSSLVCLGALSQPIFNVMLDTLPSNNYTIASTAVLNATKINTVYSPLSVASCCPANSNLEASFSAPDSVFCEGETIAFLNLSNANAQTFQWYINNVPFSTFTHPSTDTLPAGNYSVRLVADSAFCSDDTTINIRIAQKPTVSLGPDTTICQGSSITLIPNSLNAVGYLWQDSTTADSLVISQAGLYTVTITDSLGCTQTDSVQVTVAVCTGLSNVSSFGSSINLFPNPVHPTDGLLVSSEKEGKVTYQVLDIQGKTIKSGIINLSPSANYRLATSQLKEGMYFLQMQNETLEIVVRKFVIH